MSRFFELMLAEVHRYEGTVNQFLGDGIMALFGAPIAHEDHARPGGARRARHRAGAARPSQAELRRARHPLPRPRGAEHRLVVVGRIGDDLRMDYTAVGDATNVAAPHAAGWRAPGRVTISEATYRLVRGYFEARSLGPAGGQGQGRAGRRRGRWWPRARPARGWRSPPSAGSPRSWGASASCALLLEAFGACPRPAHGQVVVPRGRGRHGQVAPARRAASADRRRGRVARGALPVLRPGDALPSAGGPASAAARGRGRGHGSGHRGEGRAGPGRDRPEARAGGAVSPGAPVHRSGRCRGARDDAGTAARRDLRGAAAAAGPERRAPAAGAGDRGPALDRRRQRAVPDHPDRERAGAARAARVHLPARGTRARSGSGATSRAWCRPRSPARRVRASPRRCCRPMRSAAELRALVADKAEGNPFYVEELVRSLEETGALRTVEGTAGPHTAPVADRGARPRPGRDRRAHGPAGRGPEGHAPARLGDRTRVQPAPGRPRLPRSARARTAPCGS